MIRSPRTPSGSSSSEGEEIVYPPDVIPRFNPKSYAGKWYEIFKLPLIWEEGCLGAIAEYTYPYVKDDIVDTDSIHILNSCLDENGKILNQREGKATVQKIGHNIITGHLTVNFENNYSGELPEFLRDRPVDIDADYLIHFTDYKNFSLVGSTSRQFLWLLSRHEVISSDVILGFINLAQRFSYDTSKLKIWQNRITYEY